MSGELHGNALVTGGSRGIGRSCALAAAIAELGPLRYLVANPAAGTFGLTDELTVEDWDYSMAAHVRSLLVLAQAASPTMSQNGGGAIVAISSLGVHRVYDAFGTARAAIETLVTYLAAWPRPRPRRDRRAGRLLPLRRGADGDRPDADRRRRFHAARLVPVVSPLI